MQAMSAKHTYRLVVLEHDVGGTDRIEFEAPTAGRAMVMMQNLSGTREVEIFEDECRLGRLRRSTLGPFWTISD